MLKPVAVVAGLLSTLMILSACSRDIQQIGEERITLANLNEIPPIPPKDRYGFFVEALEVEEEIIKRNESLYIILTRHGVSSQIIHEIQGRSRGVVNLNRMVPGQKYRIYKSEAGAVAFVWHMSPLQFVTIKWDKGVQIERGEVPVEKKPATATGIIRSSLYETIAGEGVPSQLGMALADIFAWEIDFFALQRGDHFRVVYEELYANGQFIGVGDVQVAEFQHREDIYRAYYFENGERRGYFDRDGNSLEKALLKAPFRYNQRVSSGFSRNRLHPILRQRRPHYGIDYAAPTGTPVLAVGDGVVTEAQYRGGNGNIVQIRHNGTYKTAYLHLNGFAKGIRPGTRVEQGQVIGYVGSTGLATGPHLCYRLYVNDQPVNSLRVDLPASESLNEVHMAEFLARVVELDNQIDRLRLSPDLALY